MAPKDHPMRGRISAAGNRVLIALVFFGLVLTFGLMTLVDNGTTRQIALAAYFVVFALVAVFFRVRYDRSQR